MLAKQNSHSTNAWIVIEVTTPDSPTYRYVGIWDQLDTPKLISKTLSTITIIDRKEGWSRTVILAQESWTVFHVFQEGINLKT